MQRTMLKSKIHRARVTDANLHYEGSITIAADLMEAADIIPYEMVHVLDVDNGARLQTYAIPGPRGSGVMCINGAAARLVSTGDTIIVLTYTALEDQEAREFLPQVVYVNDRNEIVEEARGTRASAALSR
ncbi:MAG: aspartate 1-decarboxylase [Chloroflexi bacterium]|nr:aspartate 1-decarboxylase [Chloroflexota bacterium]